VEKKSEKIQTGPPTFAYEWKKKKDKKRQDAQSEKTQTLE